LSGTRDHRSRTCQGRDGGRRTFPAECCFQVIYFVSNIFFVRPVGVPQAPRVETIRLTGAVKISGYGGDCQFLREF
jgi:hypothetical protein